MAVLVLVAVSVLAITVAVIWPGEVAGPGIRGGIGAGADASADALMGAEGAASTDAPGDPDLDRRGLDTHPADSTDPTASDDSSVVVSARWHGDHSPAAGVSILLVSPGLGFETALPLQKRLTDARGEARFEAVPPGPWLVTATRHDAVPLLVVAGEPAHAEVLVERHGRIDGRLRDEDGRPVAGVRIYTGGMSVRGAAVVAETGDGGSFSFRANAPEVLVWAESSSAHSRSREVRLLTYDGERHEVELVVTSRVTTLRGRVVGADGRPLPGAEVFARDIPPPSPTHPEDAFFDLAHARTTCDEQGRFVFEDLSRGPLRWRAGAAGHLGRHGFLTLPDEGSAAEFEIALQHGASVSGTVRSPDGKALPGVRVTRTATEQRGVTTDAGGRFSSDGLEAGPRVLTASHPRWGTARLELELQAGEQRQLDFVLEPGLVLEGRVVDRSGAPVAGVVVAREDALVVTAADGSYRFVDCEDRDYELVVHARLGRIPAVLARRSGIRPRTGAVEFVVDGLDATTTGWIRARFRRPEGHQDAALRIELRRGKEPGFVIAVPPDGSWLAGPLQPGSWRLRAVPWFTPLDGFLREGLQVEPGATLDLGTIDLPSPTTIRLVPESRSGPPLTELRATLQQLDRPRWGTNLLWRDGRTTPVQSFTPGRWQIDVAPTDHHLGTRLVTELAPGIENVVTIQITPTRRCRFRIVAAVDGLRLDGARLGLRGAHEVEDIACRNGETTLGVPVGEHLAIVEGEGFRGSATFRVDSVEGPPLEVEIPVR